jgi:E3 ubiquitin-protein ligase BRE1
LLEEREEQTKKISGLLLASKSADPPTDEVMKQSNLYAELLSKVSAAERLVKEAQEKEQKIKEEWGHALATAAEAQKAVEELSSKHIKRWQDLAEEFPELADNGNGETKKDGADNGSDSRAKEMVTLQHKLTQALENVRQAQGTRKTLHEAVIMNEILQSKLDEIKTKYTSLQQSRSNGTPAAALEGALTPKAKSPAVGAAPAEKQEKIERPDKSDKAADKLHREYRRLQKQLAAATASKESAKAKLERAEKERDTLVSSNSRLLKQASEKDEMNAKSLSTILHLKQLTDQITKEKENLEQQVKSSQQLALSARLAANARERVSEELDKERQAMDARVKEGEEKCQTLAQEKEQIEAKLTQNRYRMASLFKDVEVAKNRCDELASESTKLEEEKQKMLESLGIARKEAEEATKLTERISKASGGAIVEGFTAEQLHTQVKHLKNRLICNVCNARDKKCILLRCRHMFCKNCVDENIKNRSRKCPACGIRFDTKDVQDIWL